MVNTNIKTGMVEDQKSVADKYEMLEGQMRQYVEKVKEEHSRKIQVLRNI